MKYKTIILCLFLGFQVGDYQSKKRVSLQINEQILLSTSDYYEWENPNDIHFCDNFGEDNLCKKS